MTNNSRLFLFACCALAFLPQHVACSDAIVVTRAMNASTIAEFFVERQGIRVEIEVGTADLDAFRNLLPDSVYVQLGHNPLPLADRISLFLQRDWVIQDDVGDSLAGQIVGVELRRRLLRDEITGEPLPVQPADAEQVLFVEIKYSWKDRPQSISIRPPTQDDTRTPKANIGFVLYHDGLPVNDFRFLGAESTVDLDWRDPWYSRFRNQNLRRQYDAPLSVYLYVDHFEVRKEVVVRPRDLQQWIDLGLEGRQTIPAEDQAALKTQVAEFLANRGDVTIDGQPIDGTLDRIHFIRRSLRTTGVVDPPESLDVTSATLGVIFVYPIEGLPQEVTMTWDLFGPKIQRVPASATDEAGGLPSVLTPEDSILVWTNFLTDPSRPTMVSIQLPPPRRVPLPVISVICFTTIIGLVTMAVLGARAGRGRIGWPAIAVAVCAMLGVVTLPYAPVSFPHPLAARFRMQPAEASALLHDLLYNVYRSFDVRDEGRVYDRLAMSISGDLLTDVFLEIRRSMELANQGGARVKIDDVEILEVASQPVAPDAALAWRCRWNASGSVGHWGHIHRRTNQYDAVIAIVPVGKAWKITTLDVREEQRVAAGATK